jgi:hypothetical protein
VLLLALPVGASAATVYVDCSGQPTSDFTSITAAINSLVGSPPTTDYDYVFLRTDCPENVTITAGRRLFIAPEWDWCPWNGCTSYGPFAKITAVDHNRPVVSIGGSENVTLVHVSLSGGSIGLQVNQGANVTAYGVVAEHNVADDAGGGGDGVSVGMGGILDWGEGGSLHNAGWGITVGGGASVNLYGHASWLQNKPLAISSNGKGGILSTQSWLNSFTGLSIEDNSGWGLVTAGGDTLIGDCCSATIIRGNEGGAFLSQDSEAVFWGSTTLRENGHFGVYAETQSHVYFVNSVYDPNVVEGHTKIGVNVTTNSQATFSGANQIRNNGSPDEPASAGVRVDGNSNAFFDQGAVVRGNAGPGILVDLNSSLDATAAVVRGNAKEAVRLRHMSVAYLGRDSSIRPNGAGPLTCDATSLAVTDLVPKSVACTNVEKPTEPRLPWPPNPFR